MSLISTIGQTAITGSAGSALGPLTGIVGQAANVVAPIAMPEPGALFNAYLAGWIERRTLQESLLVHGIDWSDLPGGPERRQVWQRVAASFETPLPLEYLYRLRAREEITDTQLQKLIGRLGFRSGQKVAALMGLRRQPLTTLESLALFRRGLIGEPRYRAELAERGVTERAIQDGLRAINEFIPTPTDLIRLMTRDVFDPRAVAAGDLDQDFAQKFQGPAVQFADWQDVSADTMRLYWRAHWDLPSPTQLYDMMHLLRPGRHLRYQQFFPGLRPVTPADVTETLKQDDKAPAWVDRLAAITFRPFALSDITRLYRWGEIDEREMQEIMRDRGVLPDDAAKLTRAFVKDVRVGELKQPLRLARDRIIEALKLGAIDEPTARRLLSDFGLDSAEQDLFISRALVEERIWYVKEVMSSIRTMALKGLVSEATARQMMMQLGIQGPRIDRHIQLWKVQLLAGKRQIAARQAINFYKRGLVSRSEVYAHLTNLNYTPNDIDLMLAAADQDLALAAARAALAAARTEAARRRALAQLAREAEAAARRARSELSRHSGPAHVKRWVKKCLISRAEGQRRLEQLGFPPDAARRELEALGPGLCV